MSDRISELQQIYRWFQHAKESADRGDARGAWSDANQGQLFTIKCIEREEERANKAKSEGK